MLAITGARVEAFKDGEHWYVGSEHITFLRIEPRPLDDTHTDEVRRQEAEYIAEALNQYRFLNGFVGQ